MQTFLNANGKVKENKKLVSKWDFHFFCGKARVKNDNFAPNKKKSWPFFYSHLQMQLCYGANCVRNMKKLNKL